MKKSKSGGDSWFDTINEYVDAHKRDVFIHLVLISIIAVLAFGYMGLKKNMILKVDIPPVIMERGELIVGYKGANKLFFRVWGEWFTSEYSSLSYLNAKEKLNRILEMVESNKAVAYKEPFQKKVAYIQNNRIKQHYIASKEYIAGDSQDGLWIFHSEGRMEEKIDNVIVPKHCEYNIGMRISNYHLLLGLINEKCKKIGVLK